MDRMKTLWRVAAATTVLVLVPVFAEHHESAAAETETPVSFNGLAQLCTLHPGKTMAQYDKMVKDADMMANFRELLLEPSEIDAALGLA